MIPTPVTRRSFLERTSKNRSSDGLENRCSTSIHLAPASAFITHYTTVEGESALGGGKKDIFGVLYPSQLQSFTVSHPISSAIQRAVLTATTVARYLSRVHIYGRISLLRL